MSIGLPSAHHRDSADHEQYAKGSFKVGGCVASWPMARLVRFGRNAGLATNRGSINTQRCATHMLRAQTALLIFTRNKVNSFALFWPSCATYAGDMHKIIDTISPNKTKAFIVIPVTQYALLFHSRVLSQLRL